MNIAVFGASGRSGRLFVGEALEKGHKVNRIISLTGGAVADPEWDKPKTMDKMIRFIMKNLAGKGTSNALLD